MKTTLYIVIPCYNEEKVLPVTAGQFKEKLLSLIAAGKISDKSRIMFVNDGSKDKTWELISQYHAEDKHYSGVNLSRNRGQQNALLAGLNTAAQFADAIITMDVDLQDDINAIDEMIEKYEDGCEVVYGVRKARKKDSFFKRSTALGFYKVINKMGGEVIYNHAEYRLMSKRAVLSLAEYKETNLFLRGLVPMVGYKSDIVFYERAKRVAGESKYPLRKLISLAYEGITSLSVKPINIIRSLGLAFSIIGLAGVIATIVLSCLGIISTSWITLAAVVAVGGILQFSLGVIGDYVGKTYMESKHRPRYFIADILNDAESGND
ncbi:MAG: glycosyltransferase family 2 protein [Clostridia bacterium]|nr:glycosyltransferase family 2 protein [Clostridia bacterium]MDE7306039.1 glycosyltransferase family 2 protein [Clostridia bacterium]